MRRPAPAALLLLLALACPVLAQIDDEEDRQREAAKDRDLQRKLPPWLYDLYRKEKDRDKPKEKSELDRLVTSARLYPLVGREPPPFSLLRADGRRVALSDFTGQVVMLYFWTTTSPYGTAELTTTLDQIQRRWRDRRFTVLAISVKEPRETVGPWVQARAVAPTVLVDSDGGVSAEYRVRVIPTAYLLDRDMRLVGRVAGTRAWDKGPERELIEYLLSTASR